MKTPFILLPAVFLALLQAADLDAQILDLQFPIVNGEVKTICLHGNTIYIGGTFTLVGGQPRTNIAAIDIPTKSVTPWAPDLNGDVVDIEAAGGKVYFCGEFTQVNSSSRNALVVVDSITGNVDPLNPAIVFPGIPGMQTGTVFSVKVVDNIFYFAGYFNSVDGSVRKNVAAVDLPSGTLNAFSVSPDIPVNLIAIEGTTLYMGGPFFNVNGSDRKGFAAVDRITGNLLPWNPSSDQPGNTIHAILPDGDSVIFSGEFFDLNSSNHCYLVKTNLDGVPSGWHPFSCTSSPSAYTLAKSDSFLVVGGNFSNFSGTNRQNLAMVDRSSGTVNNWNPGPDDDVLALAINESLIVVGGKFDMISGTARANLAVYSRDIQTGTGEPSAPAIKLGGFPNPTRSTFKIPIAQDEVKNLSIYTQDGKKVNAVYQVEACWLSIRTEALLAGAYIVQFGTADGKKYLSTFVRIP